MDPTPDPYAAVRLPDAPQQPDVYALLGQCLVCAVARPAGVEQDKVAFESKMRNLPCFFSSATMRALSFRTVSHDGENLSAFFSASTAASADTEDMG